jgi:plastocyanin
MAKGIKKSNLLLLAFVLAGMGVAFVAVSVGNKLLANQSGALGVCGNSGKTFDVRIKDDHMSPRVFTAHRCDKLTITNLDPTTREIGFGDHENHLLYDGIREKVITQNQHFTITLNQTGTYHFHDHFHDEIAGQFTIY